MQKRIRINFEIDDEELFQALKEHAKDEGRTLKYIIKEAFRKYLKIKG